MCGITGGFNISRETVQKMNELQGSRGPDNTGIHEIGKVIFGHTRLSIVDKSEKSNQPMVGSSIMLTYNGEIYNLGTKEEEDKTYYFESDTIAVHYALWGWGGEDIEKVLNGFNGMFAFGFYDEIEETITLVRDRFGIKPLYYTHQKDFFAFASTPAAVSLTKSNWDVSQKGLHEYLALGATMLHSMFEGIVAVPPGHYVTFNCKTNEIKTKRWYYPKFVENAIAEIERRVIQSIERVRLICDEPQIILLSGGIDSTLVASQFAGKSAIHLRSPEEEFAVEVAKKYYIRLNTIDPEETNAEEALTDYITKSGDPTMAGLIPYITCKEIKKLGYRVAITANGADELFYGYDRMKGLFKDQFAHVFRHFSFSDQFAFMGNQYLHGSVAQKFEIATYLIHDLNKTLDFASMCHSVEVRVPYLDHELVEAALSIPQEKHIGNFGMKHFLKKMLVDLGFSFDFIHRPKVGFSLHYQPKDWQSLQEKAMKWYKSTDYEQLGKDATGRQEAYHAATVVGLYLWMKKFKSL